MNRRIRNRTSGGVAGRREQSRLLPDHDDGVARVHSPRGLGFAGTVKAATNTVVALARSSAALPVSSQLLKTSALLLLGAAVAMGQPPPLRAAPPEAISVEVAGASEPVLCAEKDNVTLNLTSPAVRSFRIEAAHPAYLGTIQRDSFEADWTACDLSGDAVHASEVKTPTRRTLYEEPDFWLVGWTMPTYWRPATANVRIGDRVEKGLHLLQLWMIRPMGGEEVLVLYPQDGYWRLRPLAPAGQAPTAFGSSFLVGPVEIEGRPIVKIKEVVFEPKSRSFTITSSAAARPR